MALPPAAALPRAVLAAACLVLAGCATPPGNQRLALVLGNNAYENAPVLRNPVNDANDMCVSLRRLGFQTLCHTNLKDRSDFEAVVKDYADHLAPNGVGVVYYSGHGVQVGNENFLIPTRVQPRAAGEDPRRVLYGLNDLYAALRGRPVRFQLIILDACRTDLFAAATPGAASRSRSVLLRALEGQPLAGSGLAPITDAPNATMVLYATASREAAYDSVGDGRNGPLTKHILANIATPGMPVEEFFKQVTRGVTSEPMRGAQARQVPYIYGSFAGQFCFAGCYRPPVVPPLN